MVDFIKTQGNAFVAHRLRRSSDRIVSQVGEVLVNLGVSVPPRGASMLLLLDEHRSIGVMDIARQLCLSHPLIVRMAKQFEALGLVTIETDPNDARRRLLMCTDKARHEAAMLRAFNARLSVVFDSLCAEIQCPLIGVLDRLDAALDAAPIANRLAPQPPA